MGSTAGRLANFLRMARTELILFGPSLPNLFFNGMAARARWIEDEDISVGRIFDGGRARAVRSGWRHQMG